MMLASCTLGCHRQCSPVSPAERGQLVQCCLATTLSAVKQVPCPLPSWPVCQDMRCRCKTLQQLLQVLVTPDAVMRNFVLQAMKQKVANAEVTAMYSCMQSSAECLM